MHYMDPNEPSLLFVREVEKVREYFNVLTQTQLSKQTVLNYWKSLKRFMKYIIMSTSIHTKDKSLFSDCKDFISPLDGIRAGISKKVNKELTQKRYGYGKEKLPADCVVILDDAFMDFLMVMGKLQGPEAVSGEALDKHDHLLVLYYLEAIVMLKLLQRPGVVTNMTLSWFGLYFDQIRPVMLQGLRSGDDAAAEGHFFVSSTGRLIHNPCNDLKRLHAEFNIPAVSSGDARTAFETAAENLPEVERNAVARLLGHTLETDEKHYRMRTPTDAFLAQRLIEQIAGKTRHESGASTSREKREPKDGCCPEACAACVCVARDTALKLTLLERPKSVEELKEIMQERFKPRLDRDFSTHYEDPDFDGDLCLLVDTLRSYQRRAH
ncbi:unnamed protein product [Leuciscus chuanchicus]